MNNLARLPAFTAPVSTISSSIPDQVIDSNAAERLRRPGAVFVGIDPALPEDARTELCRLVVNEDGESILCKPTNEKIFIDLYSKTMQYQDDHGQWRVIQIKPAGPEILMKDGNFTRIGLTPSK